MKRKTLAARIRSAETSLEKIQLAHYGKPVPKIASEIARYLTTSAKLIERKNPAYVSPADVAFFYTTLALERLLAIDEKLLSRLMLHKIRSLDVQFFQDIADSLAGKYKDKSGGDNVRETILIFTDAMKGTTETRDLKFLRLLTEFNGDDRHLRRIAKECNFPLAPSPKGRPKIKRTNKPHKRR